MAVNRILNARARDRVWLVAKEADEIGHETHIPATMSSEGPVHVTGFVEIDYALGGLVPWPGVNVAHNETVVLDAALYFAVCADQVNLA